MNPHTGEIVRLTPKEWELLEQNTETQHKQLMESIATKYVPLTESEVQELEPLDKPKRKNIMRNKPCLCGSGKKFKRCCWSKYL